MFDKQQKSPSKSFSSGLKAKCLALKKKGLIWNANHKPFNHGKSENKTFVIEQEQDQEVEFEKSGVDRLEEDHINNEIEDFLEQVLQEEEEF